MAPMLRTTLVKFLYLLDVYTAEHNAGKPISGSEWRFLHFGPFSPQIASVLEDLSAQHAMLADQRETEDGDKEFVLYSLSDWQRVADLRQLGIPGSIQTRLHADFKRYGKDLPSLLDYVYFRTTPMTDAQPGDVLDFSGCLRIAPEDVRPVQMNKLRPKAIKLARNKLREMITSRKAQERVEQGPYDEAYYAALSILDGDPLVAGFAGRAKLKV